MKKKHMIILNKDWMTTGVLDYEYKTYQLLAFLQKVEKEFNDLKLYPYYTDLINHYDSLLTYRINKSKYNNSTPKKIVDVDLKQINIQYKDIVHDTEYLKDIDKIIEFSINNIKRVLLQGKDIYDEIRKCIQIFEVGPIKHNSQDGFFLIKGKTIDVYEYKFSGVILKDKNKMFKTKLIRTYPKDSLNILTYESIRLDLISSTTINKPSLFVVDTPFEYPTNETLIPIVKRIMIRKILKGE